MRKIISAIKNFFTSAAHHTLSALIYVTESVKDILVLLLTIAFAIFAILQGKKQAKNAYNLAKQTIFGAPAARPNASKPLQAEAPNRNAHLADVAESEKSSITSIPVHETLRGGGLSK